MARGFSPNNAPALIGGGMAAQQTGRFPLTNCLLPLLFAAWAGPALAQNTTTSSSAEPRAGEDQNEWKFATVTYAWLAGAKGEVDVIESVDPVHLDLSFGDVLDSLKFVVMGAAEAQKGRLVLLGDLTFIHLQADKGIDIRDQDFVDAELDSRTIDITALAGYRVADKGPVKIDLLGGVRANFFKNTLELTGPNRSAEGERQETWFDPLLGLRANVPLDGKWGMSFYGDIGGFGIASDLTWQGMATVDYDLNDRMRLMAGWRHFNVDYDKGDFLYDVEQSGLLLAFRYQM